MIRTHAVIWIVLVAVAAGFLFYTSHQAQELEAELDARHRAVIAEREAIRILHAEWAYLNEPGRLRELAKQYTRLGPAMPVQIIASIDDIPAVLPGVAAAPAVPLPRRKPLPGPPNVLPNTPPDTPMASTPPDRVPTVAASFAPPSETPLHALLASFRALQSNPSMGAGQ